MVRRGYMLQFQRKKNWCERGELNPHGYPLDPKSSASASSATLATDAANMNKPRDNGALVKWGG